MRRNQLLAGIMTAMAAVMPVVNVYVDTAAASEILTSDEYIQNETNINKTTVLQNSVKMTDCSQRKLPVKTSCSVRQA